MRTILAGAATLAFAATIGVLPTTAFANPGGDHGPAMKQGNGNAAAAKNDKAAQGPQKGNAAAGPAMKAANTVTTVRGNGNGNANGDGNGNKAKAGPDNRNASAPMKPGKPDKAERTPGNNADRGNSGNGKGNANNGKANNGRANNGKANNGKAMPVNNAGRNNGTKGFADRDGMRDADINHGARRVTRVAHIDRTINHGLIDGCPPGLASKGTDCTPPGQFKKQPDTWRAFYDRPSWWGYNRLSGNDYRYDNGYLYRMRGDSILGYIPLLGGALSIGNQWPSYYRQAEVPSYYVDYYNLGQSGAYRYADNVLYRVDPGTQAITSIAALLTGDQFNVGQPMPAGYGVYNVPYAYQDRYYDGPDASYRYADGYVYQVDPKTRLITAAIELLT